jgi:hypothetical protein
MEINYELKPEDFFQFAKENAPTQTSHRPMVILYAVLYLTFMFADVIYVLLSGWNNWNLRGLLISIFLRSIFCFASVFIAVGVIKLFTNRQAKKILAEPPNGLFCEHRIILTEKELIELTDVNTSRYSWKAIGEIKESESFVLINVLMSSSYLIPKRHFQDRRQIGEFIETAKQYRQNAENSFQLSHLIGYEKSLQ